MGNFQKAKIILLFSTTYGILFLHNLRDIVSPQLTGYCFSTTYGILLLHNLRDIVLERSIYSVSSWQVTEDLQYSCFNFVIYLHLLFICIHFSFTNISYWIMCQVSIAQPYCGKWGFDPRAVLGLGYFHLLCSVWDFSSSLFNYHFEYPNSCFYFIYYFSRFMCRGIIQTCIFF